MKKCLVMLSVVILLNLLIGSTAFAAGSASITISNYTKVEQGKSYTYKITVKINDTMDFLGTIEFSGVFSHSKKTMIFQASDDEINGKGTLTYNITLKIPATAALGSTGSIHINGQGSHYDKDSGKTTSYKVKKELTATVVDPGTSTSIPSTKTAKPKPKPTATPAPTEWDIAAQNVQQLSAGGTLNLDVKDRRIPPAFLQKLKERKARLVMGHGGYSCTVDGAALLSVPPNPIDFTMSMDRNEALSKAAGGADLYQLHFAHSGQLPGRFLYKFKASASKPGDRLYLYHYYDQSGAIEGTQSASVDQDGFVTFGITHCSSYFVTAAVLHDAGGIVAEDTTSRQAAEEAGRKLGESESRLLAAQGDLTKLEEQLNVMINQLQSAKAEEEKLSQRLSSKSGISPAALVMSVCAAALLASALTMLLYGVGIFRKKPAPAALPLPEEGADKSHAKAGDSGAQG